jgi:lysophospholipase L1-like esterase
MAFAKRLTVASCLFWISLAVGDIDLAVPHDLLSKKLEQRASDPRDNSWIRNWAAIGDSFTAGIGSGNLYSNQKSDWACSRYDYSYPAILNRYFGRSVNRFTYAACSGATSQDISGQISTLPSGQDLVVMTAGGNDLCLVGAVNLAVLKDD